MNQDWQPYEIELIVADYFNMLIDEINELPVNKTEHRNAIKPLLNSRSDGSIEFKHQNISAILGILGLPFIRGYKPRFNFQKSLQDKVIQYIDTKNEIEQYFLKFSDNFTAPQKAVDYTNLIVPSPKESVVSEPSATYITKAVKINYLEKEQQNRNLGQKGEELVIEFEKWSLINMGKESLADRIEWVSKEQGDGLGFDILSRNPDGTDKYIEVKTTKLSKETPIFFTLNEYNFSINNENRFHLYRLFNFSQEPKMFKNTGRYDKFCGSVNAIQFKGYF